MGARGRDVPRPSELHPAEVAHAEGHGQCHGQGGHEDSPSDEGQPQPAAEQFPFRPDEPSAGKGQVRRIGQEPHRHRDVEERNDNILAVSIDGLNHELDLSDVGNFSDLLRKVELELVSKDRVVTHIVLNGESLTEEQESLYAGFGIGDVATLEILTEEPVKLALTSLNDTLEYLPELAGTFERTAKTIRSGDYAVGLEYLQESLQMVQSFNMLIDGIRQVLMVDFFQIKLENDEGDNFATLNSRMSEIAKEILTSAESEDWTELADLLEYELSPLLYRYLGAIPFVIDAVNNREGKN